MSTTTMTATRLSTVESQPAVAWSVKIHRFSPNVTYIPPRPVLRRATENSAKPESAGQRYHRRMRSNTTPPIPSPNLLAGIEGVAPPRKSEDCSRPVRCPEERCKWRLHSAVNPCLCERNETPVDVLNLRQLAGANTPWLGSPSYTNFW